MCSVSSIACTVCMFIHPYVVADAAGSVVLCTVTATMGAFVLSHSISSIKQVCPTVRTHLSNSNRGRGKGRPLRLRMQNLPHSHCIAYTLLPRSHSPYIYLVQMSKLSARNMVISKSFSMGAEHFVLMCKHNN